MLSQLLCSKRDNLRTVLQRVGSRLFFLVVPPMVVLPMERSSQSGALFQTVAPLVRGMGFDIVELVGKQVKQTFHVNLVIHRDSGVDIADCTRVYKAVYPRLEVAVDVEVHLEVSSPGVYRKFKDAREFAIFTGSKVKVLPENQSEWLVGMIGDATDEHVEIEEEDAVRTIRFEDIRKAQLAYP